MDQGEGPYSYQEFLEYYKHDETRAAEAWADGALVERSAMLDWLQKLEDVHLSDALEDWEDEYPEKVAEGNVEWEEEKASAIQEFEVTVRRPHLKAAGF